MIDIGGMVGLSILCLILLIKEYIEKWEEIREETYKLNGKWRIENLLYKELEFNKGVIKRIVFCKLWNKWHIGTDGLYFNISRRLVRNKKFIRYVVNNYGSKKRCHVWIEKIDSEFELVSGVYNEKKS